MAEDFSRPAVLILAAGLGKRMKSEKPKVLHEIAGISLIQVILTRVREALPGAPIGVVVGHGRDQVEQEILTEGAPLSVTSPGTPPVILIDQPQQRGTGDAVRCALEHPWGQSILKEKRPILVLPGDQPLITREFLLKMSEPLPSKGSIRLASCRVGDPRGYGRVVRRGSEVFRVVEDRDCSEKEKQISEVATSSYLFESAFLYQAIKALKPNNAQGEYYLTDAIGIARQRKRAVQTLLWEDAEDLMGINTPWDLTQAWQIFNSRLIRHWAERGVYFVSTDGCMLDFAVELSEGVRVSQNVTLQGKTRVGVGTVLEPGVFLRNVEVGAHCTLKSGTYAEGSVIGERSSIGPYAHLRPETQVGQDCKIGNFVELKKTRVGDRTSIAHLSYLGDAKVGRNVNIGCGFVTCNFDGRVIDGKRKHETLIEDDVFLGSDCQTVAPVKIGRGAYVASGSTITQDVAPGDLAIARSRQVNKPGYATKFRQRERAGSEKCVES